MLGFISLSQLVRIIFKEQRLCIVYMNKNVDSQKKNIRYFVVKLNLKLVIPIYTMKFWTHALGKDLRLEYLT